MRVNLSAPDASRPQEGTAGAAAGSRLRAIGDERCVQAWVETSRPYGVTELVCLPLHVAADEHRIFVAGRPDPSITGVTSANIP